LEGSQAGKADEELFPDVKSFVCLVEANVAAFDEQTTRIFLAETMFELLVVEAFHHPKQPVPDFTMHFLFTGALVDLFFVSNVAFQVIYLIL
jgi:hypothetical protein